MIITSAKIEICILKVITAMNKIRDLLTEPQNMRVHMAVHVDTAAINGSPQSAWIEEMLPADKKKEGTRYVFFSISANCAHK